MESNPKHLSTFNTQLELPGWNTVRRVRKQDEDQEGKFKAKRSNSGLAMILNIKGGRAFIENHIDEELTEKGEKCSMMKILVQLGSFRAQSKLFPAEVEPAVDESFTIPLSALGFDVGFSTDRPTREQIVQRMQAVSKSREKLSLLVLRHTPYGEVSTFGYAATEWRWVLHNGVAVELAKLSNGTTTPCGMLEIEMQVQPRVIDIGSKAHDSSRDHSSTTASDSDDENAFIPRTDLRRQIDQDTLHASQLEQQFRKFTKAWWLEYQYMRPEHQNRYVRLFAMTESYTKQFHLIYMVENGDTSIYTLCAMGDCSKRSALSTPLHAARFVRLLAYRKDVSIDGERTERWHSPHAFLAKGVGDIEDHALLLCSLFLGFGLDAYVCTGLMYQRMDSAPQVANRPRHSIGFFVWVATKSPDDPEHVHFWNPLTGEKHDVRAHLIALKMQSEDARFEYGLDHDFPFVAVHTIFNDKSFYANIQLNDSVETCTMDLSEESVWKAIPSDIIRPIPHYDVEIEIEQSLKHLIAEYRAKYFHTNTPWCDDLSYIVRTALGPYETERVTGQPYGNDEFQQAVQNFVPPGFVFKGLPFQFHHQQTNSMLYTMLEHRGATSKSFKESLALATPDKAEKPQSPETPQLNDAETSPSPLRFGLAVKVFTYAEEVAVTWIILSVVHAPEVHAASRAKNQTPQTKKSKPSTK